MAVQDDEEAAVAAGDEMKEFFDFARDFFNVGEKHQCSIRGSNFGAPGSGKFRCKKCAGCKTQMMYDKSRDVLRNRCCDCGYEWDAPTSDKKVQAP